MIRVLCTKERNDMTNSLREDVFAYVRKKYKDKPEYLWARFPDYAVFRHSDNQKWFGIVMDISYDKIDRGRSGTVDILNVKIGDILMRELLLQQEGYYIGYHISRGNWLSVVLDGTVPIDEIKNLIDLSFAVTASAKKKQEMRPPKAWLVPSNPKYYDVVKAFNEAGEINWKQGKGIKKGDTVFLYVGAPISSILYKCLVTETDIPYEFRSDELTIKSLMKIKLQKRYEPGDFNFDRLGTEFGIFAVRGQRGVPKSLADALG